MENESLKITGKRNTQNNNNNNTISIEKTFNIDTSKVDTSQLPTANLSNGVLIIKIPKKAPHVINVAQQQDLEKYSQSSVVLSLDVPGVKLEDLEVFMQGHDGLVHVKGKRTIGATSSTIHKTVSFDPNHTDLSQIKASLVRGVLVISVPKKQKQPARNIEISSEKEIEVTTATDNDNNDDDEPAVDTTTKSQSQEEESFTEDAPESSINVETVAEEAEQIASSAKTVEWEQIE